MKEFLFFILMIPSAIFGAVLIGRVLIKMRHWVEKTDERKQAAAIIIVLVTALSLAGALVVGFL